MAAATILDFQICEILLADGVWRAQTHNCTKFRQNQTFHCGDIAIFRIFKMAAVRHIGFVWGIFGPPTVSTRGSLSLCKIWFCSSFYNMNISIFDAFGWKMRIHAPKIGVFGLFDPQNGEQYQRRPKKAHPCVSPCHLSH